MATQSISVALPESERPQVAKLYRILLSGGMPALVGPSGASQELPQSVYEVLRKVLATMKEGKAITLFPETEELTTQKAAEILGVSRQYLVRRLEDGRIRFYRAGSHRRVCLNDLLAYKRQRDTGRLASIRKLAQADVEAGDYDTFIPPEDCE